MVRSLHNVGCWNASSITGSAKGGSQVTSLIELPPRRRRDGVHDFPISRSNRGPWWALFSSWSWARKKDGGVNDVTTRLVRLTLAALITGLIVGGGAALADTLDYIGQVNTRATALTARTEDAISRAVELSAANRVLNAENAKHESIVAELRTSVTDLRATNKAERDTDYALMDMFSARADCWRIEAKNALEYGAAMTELVMSYEGGGRASRSVLQGAVDDVFKTLAGHQDCSKL